MSMLPRPASPVRRAIFLIALISSFAVLLPSALAAVNLLLWRNQSPLGTFGALALRGDVDSQGNYYYGGASADLEDGVLEESGHAFLRKQGPRGGVLWTKEFGAGDFSAILDIAVDKRHDWIYVVGLTSGKLPNQRYSGGVDAVIRKYKRDGAIYWTRQFGGGGNDFAAGVAVGPGGNVVITGAIGSGSILGYASGPFDWDPSNGFVRKYGPGGKLLSARRFGTSGTDIGTDVAIDRRGQVFIVGVTDGTFAGQRSSGLEDAFLLKLTKSGRTAWVKQFGRPSSDFATGVAIEPRGNVYVVGSAGPRAFVRKYTPGGARLWTRLWSDYLALGVAVDTDRSLYVVGAKSVASDLLLGDTKAFARKYSNTGRKLWTRDVAQGVATGVAVTTQNELVVSGVATKGLSQFEDPRLETLNEPLTKVFVAKFAGE